MFETNIIVKCTEATKSRKLSDMSVNSLCQTVNGYDHAYATGTALNIFVLFPFVTRLQPFYQLHDDNGLLRINVQICEAKTSTRGAANQISVGLAPMSYG